MIKRIGRRAKLIAWGNEDNYTALDIERAKGSVAGLIIGAWVSAIVWLSIIAVIVSQ